MYKYLYNINTPQDLKNLNVRELDILANEIRKFLVKSVSKTGGHLAPNLGVVELTLALHHTFESPKDKLVWDVGHQAYVHKIITGRRDSFHTLKQYKGLSGFPKRKESIHDIFETGHSSTSISAAVGLAMSRDIKKEKHAVIAVIGDGALTGGMAFEALNHLGNTKTNMIVVLNDNEMSIDKNVGSVSNYLFKLRTNRAYKKIKDEFENFTNFIPKIGNKMYKTADRFKDSLKYFMIPGAFFEEMGIKYFGPIDGHNVEELIHTFENIKKVEGPVLVHVITKKGKGYKFAENHPEQYHGVSPFKVEEGVGKNNKITYSSTAGEKLTQLAKEDERVVAITAAMPSGTGLNTFKKEYPDRFFDVGIAEGHAVTFGAGLAANGLKPYFAVYSTFLQRGYDQILHDVAIQNLPVTFLIDRAGLVGEDGETHHGVFDLSYLNMIPNLTIMAPKDKMELEKMMDYSIKAKGPIAIRYPRGEAKNLNTEKEEGNILKWEILNKGETVAIIAIGGMVKHALKAMEILKEKGINPTVINGRCLKPMDEEIITSLSKEYKYIFTVEDNVLAGGFGTKINLSLTNLNFQGKIINIALPDCFIEHGKVELLYEQYGLSPEKIGEKIVKEMNLER